MNDPPARVPQSSTCIADCASNARLKILAIAFACNPRIGSEEGVGWGWINAIATRHQVDVVTAAFHRGDIERFTPDNPAHPQNIRFHYVQEKDWHYRPTPMWKSIERSVVKPVMNLAYAGWQRDAYRLACRLHQAKRFDLVHLVTYVGFRFPGQFWKMDIPLVWGPIGGLENTPWRFLPSMGPSGCLFFAGRNVINSLQRRFLSGPKQSFAKAAKGGAIIAATEGIRREIRRWYGHESQVICEIGPPPVVACEPRARQANEPLRLVWSGAHDPGKALPLLLKALAEVRCQVRGEEEEVRSQKLEVRRAGPTSDLRPPTSHLSPLTSHLTVLGAGPCTAKWKLGRSPARWGFSVLVLFCAVSFAGRAARFRESSPRRQRTRPTLPKCR